MYTPKTSYLKNILFNMNRTCSDIPILWPQEALEAM